MCEGRLQQPGGLSNLWLKKCRHAAAVAVSAAVQYLQTPDGGVGCVGKLLLRQVVHSPLVTWDPVGQEALVTRPVRDGVGGGTRQAEQNRVIGQADIGQAKSHPLAVEVPGSGLLAVL